ncbi:NUDIX hydrolase [Bacillus solitudinis]|uniref:NUDIX hydrolase n=1 Tax=Bacillus solitudinis TaxID=2014074 RepID=UPI000C23F2D3|nr:NUDIX hydrolase [Bacillus solitudinis]
MGTGTKLVDKLQQRLAFSDIQDFHQEIDNSEMYSGVYLFLSFDLVNSTSFKSRHSSEWQKVFTLFYQMIEAKFNKYYKGITLWKYIGDEVLLYLKVTDIEQLYDCAPITSKIVDEVTAILYEEVEIAKKVLFIKATLWIANVNYLDSQDIEVISKKQETPKNIVFFTGAGPGPVWLKEQNIDFLGPDIDLGFRLGHHTEKSKILISAELAYILNRRKGEIENYQRETKYVVNDCYKIVSLEQLKGIWGERRYPIIWYGESWGKNNFDYDEHLESDFVKNILGKSVYPMDIVGKIFDDLGKTEELEEIISTIDKTPREHSELIPKYDVPKERLAEIHCAAICFDIKGRMLIAKRKMSKTRLKGLWEFGCGQLEINQTIKDCIRKNYLNDFNAELSFENPEPIPITTYEIKIEKEDRVVPGMLFLAIIDNPEKIVANNHDAIDWIEEHEVLQLAAETAVKNFHRSAQIAFNIYKTLTFKEDKLKVTPYDILDFLRSRFKPGDQFVLGGKTYQLLLGYLKAVNKPIISMGVFREIVSELERMGLVNDEDIGEAMYWSLKDFKGNKK